MTKIKLCGLSRPCDIETANQLKPEYIGFIFVKKSKRYVSPETAAQLKSLLDPAIQAVGVFVKENPDAVAKLLNDGIIDAAQLHGGKDEAYIHNLRVLTDKPLIQAFRVDSTDDVEKACKSSADYILLDSGSGGTGTTFDWTLLLGGVNRPYFLAGGLSSENAGSAVRLFHPYAVGIETDGLKDAKKMADFVSAVRKEDIHD